MTSIKTKLVHAFSATALALVVVTPIMAADVTPSSASADAFDSAERRADLALWKRSGAPDYQTAASYGPSQLPAYEAAVKQYNQWRHGPEFTAEVLRQKSSDFAKR